MENNKNKNIADTMELESILNEARRNREKLTIEKKPVVSKTVVTRRNFDDDFVLYTDDEPIIETEKVTKEKQNSPKRQTKPAREVNKKAIAIAVSVAVVFVLLITFAAFKIFGNFKYSDNIYINGISIAGMSQREARLALESHISDFEDDVKLTIQANEQNVVLTDDNLDITFDIDSVLSQAKDYSKSTVMKNNRMDFNIPFVIDNSSCVNAVKDVASKVDSPAVDAKVVEFDSTKEGNDRFVFEDGKNGVAIRQTELVNQLHSLSSVGTLETTVKAQIDETKPKYTKEYILLNLKKLSSFTTTSTNNANGNSNMKLSLSKCNNSIINPGDTWSFNKCTGNSNLTSNGYKPAGVLINGRSETGIGGGICQSSTTIYNAALLCGMEVVERECHYYKSSYVDAGRDATIDYGHIDLKLKNIFDYQLFMECYMDGVVLHCNIYGLPNPEFDEIKIDSEITEYLANGFRAETSRTYYLKGEKLKTEKLPKSRYYTSAPSSGTTQTPTDEPTDEPTGEGSDTPTTPVEPPTSESSGEITPPVTDAPPVEPPVVETPTPVPEDTVTE